MLKKIVNKTSLTLSPKLSDSIILDLEKSKLFVAGKNFVPHKRVRH